ncbi:MAG TPA: HEAT repeat domain-containing protein, partial [Blastocatellia bacterium]|nr:HEAT repeat domain-containing protein [Blastocatellia bacterium]
MRETFLAIYLILFAWLSSPAAFSQQAADSKDSTPNPALARAQQLIALIDSSGVNALPKLKQALSDESWYVRGEAARALGRLGDKSAGPFLLPLLQDQSWFVRSAALQAIASLGGSIDAAALRELTTTPDAYVRASAIVSSAAGNSAAGDSLIQALGDHDELVRRAAATALGELRVANAVDTLAGLLKDEDPGVRKASAVALGLIGDKRSESAVRASVPETAAGQWEYAVALYRLGNRDHLDQITAALRSEYADDRQGALNALMEFGDNGALPALLSLAANDGPTAKRDALHIRLALARGFAAFEGEQSRTALITMLGDDEPAVRAAAVASLLKISRPDPKGDFSQRSLIAMVGALKKENSPVVIDAITEALAGFD